MKSLFSLLLTFCLWHMTIASSPILIIPGILGSQMEAKLNKSSVPSAWCSKHSDWFTVWVSAAELTPLAIDCWINNTGLLFQDGIYSNSEGVQIRAPGFGGTDTVEYLDPSTKIVGAYMNVLVDYLTKHGYVKEKSLRAAPYDWRLSPDLLAKVGYYDNVKQLIETMYQDNNNSAVTIVAHSLGSPTTLYFFTEIVSQQWKDLYVKAFVTLSGVWKGSLKTMRSIISGYNEDIPVVKSLTVRPQQRSVPSSYFLMPVPDENVWNKYYIAVQTASKNYTVYDYKELFTDMGYPQGYDQYLANPSFLATLPPPNVPVYCFYGSEVDTPTSLVYKQGDFPDSDPTMVMGPGDGSVNDISLEACAVWKQKQNCSVEIRGFPGVAHESMVSDSSVLAEVLNIASKLQ